MKGFLRVLAVGVAAGVCLTIYIVFICNAQWCTPFSLGKIRQAVNYSTCRDVGFPAELTHPRSCTTGLRVFWEDDRTDIRIFAPLDGLRVGLPLVIQGEANVGSGSLQFRLTDQRGDELVQDVIPAPRAASGQYVRFSSSVYYPRPLGTGGTLQVFIVPLAGSQERGEVDVPLTLTPTASAEVKMYFGNRERDPHAQACDVSYPVARRIPLSEDLLLASLRELLHGPTLTEKRQLFFTNIPTGVVIQSMKFEEGKAMVDFSSQLKQAVTPCGIDAIRSQIERTLKQFTAVQTVELTVDGKQVVTTDP